MTAIIVHMAEKKLLKQSEAQTYVGLNPTQFKTWCTVNPIIIAGKERRYHVDDLDHWIEEQKKAQSSNGDDEYLARLK